MPHDSDQPDASTEHGPRGRLRSGSLFSGYGGLDLAVEEVFDGGTVWFSEINPAAARVFAHRWPGVPNLGDITTIDWSTVAPVDIVAGGFPCQDVSTAGNGAGLAPGTRTGLWTHMAAAIAALQPAYVVAENVRGLLSAPATRPGTQGDDCAHCNLAARAVDAVGDLEPDARPVGDRATQPVLRALGAVLGDLADLGYDTQWCGLPLPRSARPTPAIASSSSPIAAVFRTPLASDSSRGGETLKHVKARHGTIALSHQVIDLALNPPPSEAGSDLWRQIGTLFAAGDATPSPSPDGNT